MTVSGSGISWAICKSAPRSRQITTPAPHHSVFLQAGCPSCHPTNSVKALKSGLQTISKALSKCLRFDIFCVNVLLYLVGRKLVGLCCWCLLDFRAHFLSDLYTYKRRLCFYYTVNFVLVYHILSVVPVITERCCIPKM